MHSREEDNTQRSVQDSANSAGELRPAPSGGPPEPPDLFELPPRVRNVLHREPVVYREALLGILRGNDAALAAAAVRLLLALVQSRAVDPELLDVAGGLPSAELTSMMVTVCSLVPALIMAGA